MACLTILFMLVYSYYRFTEVVFMPVALVIRSMYKDFVLLLQEDRLLSNDERKRKVIFHAR